MSGIADVFEDLYDTNRLTVIVYVLVVCTMREIFCFDFRVFL